MINFIGFSCLHASSATGLTGITNYFKSGNFNVLFGFNVNYETFKIDTKNYKQQENRFSNNGCVLPALQNYDNKYMDVYGMLGNYTQQRIIKKYWLFMIYAIQPFTHM